MNSKIIIAIDGYSSCGKSTLARDLAGRLNYRYIDTGAMYRAVTFYLHTHNIDAANAEALEKALADIALDFEYDSESGKQQTILNKVNIEKEIRQPEISARVSPVSSIRRVREFLVAQQQLMGKSKGIVMDGRDIGTVVFPDAELKLFMTADEDVRAQRRYDELQASGIPASLEEVKANIKERDHLDTTRKESPLRQAEDAVVLDNSELDMDAQLQLVLDMVMNKAGDSRQAV